MENNQQEILEKLERNTRQQLLFTKVLCVSCVLVVICTLVLMFAITGAASQLMELAQPLQTLTGQLQNLAAEAQTVMDDLALLAEALVSADLGSIADNVNALASESQSAVAEAMGKLDSIDISTLNKAIKDLAAVVEPLAKVSSIFG